MMEAWLAAIEGTPAAGRLALVLALAAAVLHAVFGALQKGRFDPWLARGAMDLAYSLLAWPVALFLVPWPDRPVALALAGAMPIHIGYKLLQAWAYERGHYGLVYPVVRGTGPLLTVLAAGMVFGEHFTPTQWLGVGFLLAGIWGLGAWNLLRLPQARRGLVAALVLSLAAGAFVGLYTTWDAWGVRLAANPFTFIAWFFALDGLNMLPVTVLRWRAMPPAARPRIQRLVRHGLIGALVAFGSFGSIMMATRLDKVGEVAVLRETSAVFAVLIAWLALREPVGPVRMFCAGLIAAGALLVEGGG